MKPERTNEKEKTEKPYKSILQYEKGETIVLRSNENSEGLSIEAYQY